MIIVYLVSSVWASSIQRLVTIPLCTLALCFSLFNKDRSVFAFHYSSYVHICVFVSVCLSVCLCCCLPVPIIVFCMDPCLLFED